MSSSRLAVNLLPAPYSFYGSRLLRPRSVANHTTNDYLFVIPPQHALQYRRFTLAAVRYSIPSISPCKIYLRLPYISLYTIYFVASAYRPFPDVRSAALLRLTVHYPMFNLLPYFRLLCITLCSIWCSISDCFQIPALCIGWRNVVSPIPLSTLIGLNSSTVIPTRIAFPCGGDLISIRMVRSGARL